MPSLRVFCAVVAGRSLESCELRRKPVARRAAHWAGRKLAARAATLEEWQVAPGARSPKSWRLR